MEPSNESTEQNQRATHNPGAAPPGDAPAALPGAPDHVHPQKTAQPDKQSGLGIASFVIGVSALVISLLSIIGLVFSNFDVLVTSINEQMTDEELANVILSEAPMLIIGVLMILVSSFLTFIGAVLGIAGLLQPNRKRLFAIMGTVLNGAMVMFILFVGLLGFIAQA